MQENTWFVVVAILFIWLFVAIKNRKRTEKLVLEKVATLGKQNSKDKFYICTAGEPIDKDLIQFYGQPYKVDITPGMKLTAPNGSQFTILEVYADDNTPDKPDSVMPETNKNTALLIRTASFNWDSFNSALKRDKVLALKVT